MIVKVKRNHEKPSYFSYYEGDSITQSKSKATPKSLFDILNSDTQYILSYDDSNKEIEYTQLIFYKNLKPVQCVVTNHRTYLMNNEGKTIDKLH